MAHLSDYYGRETCMCPNCGAMITTEYLVSVRKTGEVLGCADCVQKPKCRHPMSQSEQEYVPAIPTISELQDRVDQRERFFTYRYWCGACGVELAKGRTWAM